MFRCLHKTLQKNGFTLVEVLTVVAIVGILAATAAPAFRNYILTARTSEAITSLRNIYNAEIGYFFKGTSARDGTIYTPRFLTTPLTPPTVPQGTKVIADWSQEEWKQLGYGQDGPVLFSYQAVATGLSTGAAFTARATGDQDGDGVQSYFERIGYVDSTTGDIVGGQGIYMARQIE